MLHETLEVDHDEKVTNVKSLDFTREKLSDQPKTLMENLCEKCEIFRVREEIWKTTWDVEKPVDNQIHYLLTGELISSLPH